ncbi:MAG TPA: nucleotidyltransferase family protein [Magnetospirillum sp.]|nr:nucleotidyltransferase family protein [Magnetospirillum sp.]
MTPDGLDWNSFAACAAHHRLVLRLPAPEMLGAPEAVRTRLHAMRQRAAGHNLLLHHALAEITAAFRRENVPIMAIKGPAFAALLFAEPLTREARDLDFLVHRQDAARATEILAALGYAPSPTRTEPECLEFTHGANWPRVELHTALASDDRLLPAAILRPFERSTTVTVGGEAISTLAAEAAVVFAAVHGCRHMWARLFWLADVAVAVRKGQVDWNAAFALARQLDVERQLALALVMARDCLSAPLPDAATADAALLAWAEAAAAPLHCVLTTPPLTDRQAIYRIGLVRSLVWSASLYTRPAGRRAVLAGALAATEDDRRLISLPAALGWLYPLIRPFRILMRRLTT